MRKVFLFIAVCLAFSSLVGCDGKKKTDGDNAPTLVDSNAAADYTLYGICGEGTSMSVLELITDKGDTLSLLLEGADTCSNVQGGLLAGDHLAVISCKTADGELFAKSVLNITSLMGKWTSIDRHFVIEEGGVVTGDDSEPNPYVEWKINNGRLVLSSDTFSVYGLGPDSLLLENQKGIYSYKRDVKQH